VNSYQGDALLREAFKPFWQVIVTDDVLNGNRHEIAKDAWRVGVVWVNDCLAVCQEDGRHAKLETFGNTADAPADPLVDAFGDEVFGPPVVVATNPEETCPPYCVA
jgi:hypothetical protein